MPSTVPMDRIHLKNISVDCIIGDLAWEREERQPIRCDLTLETDFRKVGQTDQLHDTINYAAVGRLTVSFLSEAHYQMLEALAEGLAAALLQEFPLTRLTLSLWKQAHFPATQEVGVTITRPAAA